MSLFLAAALLVVPSAAQVRDGSTVSFRVLVVPLRYQSPPSTSDVAIAAHANTLPQITQANAQASFAKIAAWWGQETYGLRRLDVSVLPAVSLPGSPGCNSDLIIADAQAAAKAAGAAYDKLAAITPYSCWQSHMVTVGNVVISWNIQGNEPGQLAHELGHAFGLGHNARRMPEYVVYGSSVDQMGPATTGFRHFLADHKERLGVLKPLPCASATLRSIYAFPDAIRCGPYFADYLPDLNEVWIHKREIVNTSYGSSDTTDVAKLAAGQSWSADGYTFTHAGKGKVTISAP